MTDAELLPALTPASLDDAWRTVPGDSEAHLFPAAGGPCLCGLHGAKRAGERASPTHAVRVGREAGVYRPYCGACLILHVRRWRRAGTPEPN